MNYLFTFLLLISSTAAYSTEDALFDRYHCRTTEEISLEESESGYSRILKYRICIEKTFSTSTQDLISRSFERFTKTMAKGATYRCYRSSTNQLATPGTHRETLASFSDRYLATPLGGAALSLITDLPYVLISPRIAPTPWGRFVESTDLLEGKGNVSPRNNSNRFVALTVDASVVGSPDLPFANDESFWATALGMSYLTQLGVVSDPSNPAESPLHELGKCLLWEGKIPELFRTLKEPK